MSSNFTGVTFANQKATPSDDAIIRRAILPDGILTGCKLSYSGSTLTMTAGQLMICGRQIPHPAAQNWAVVGATSGYARLLLTIDLTRTATKEVFDQVVDTIEYASAEDGFPDLEQTDINVSGSRYQVAACVVSLGPGGITGIVSQMELSRVDGAGLNFKVVGGVTQPSDPSENMIWVNTPEKITSWIFSATEPAEPVEGMVWIKTVTASQVEFNALKKYTLMVYPLAAKQYVDGAWVNVTAKIYQGGEWVEWLDGGLYVHGDTCDSVTGGWETSINGINSNYPNTGAEPTLTYNSDNVFISQERNSSCLWHTKNKISLSEKTKLSASLSNITCIDNSQCVLQIRNGITGYVDSDEVIASAYIVEGYNKYPDVTIDLSGLNLGGDSKYYVCIGVYSGVSANIESIKLE